MNRSEKEVIVDSLRQKLSSATLVAAIEFNKLDAKTSIEMRKALREGGVEYRVVKNTLAVRAIEGTSAEPLKSKFKGPLALAIAQDDPIAAAKVLAKFFKTAQEKISVKGAFAVGQLHDAGGIEKLSKLPGLPELRSQLLAMINTPATMVVRLIGTPGEQVARVIKAKADKGE